MSSGPWLGQIWVLVAWAVSTDRTKALWQRGEKGGRQPSPVQVLVGTNYGSNSLMDPCIALLAKQ